MCPERIVSQRTYGDGIDRRGVRRPLLQQTTANKWNRYSSSIPQQAASNRKTLISLNRQRLPSAVTWLSGSTSTSRPKSAFNRAHRLGNAVKHSGASAGLLLSQKRTGGPGTEVNTITQNPIGRPPSFNYVKDKDSIRQEFYFEKATEATPENDSYLTAYEQSRLPCQFLDNPSDCYDFTQLFHHHDVRLETLRLNIPQQNCPNDDITVPVISLDEFDLSEQEYRPPADEKDVDKPLFGLFQLEKEPLLERSQLLPLSLPNLKLSLKFMQVDNY